jgi:demethylmenaquinone methyltransferase / 2-methoxy-6-polyprenyl-1,4-benzoquinol methylase
MSGEAKGYPPVKTMSEQERIGVVKEIFSTVTGRYDFLNHLLSLGLDIAWRRFAVRKMGPAGPGRLLDVATGTADLAIETALRYPQARVTGLDFAGAMMTLGQAKVRARGLSEWIHFVRGDALALPFPEGSFDEAAVAFGLRNMPGRRAALGEMRRILVPGGKLLILEMTFPRGRFWSGVLRFYLTRVLPRLARAFSRNPAAYTYLGDSILNFPGPDAFSEELRQAGFSEVRAFPLHFGITCLHLGIKPGIREAATGKGSA